MEKVIKNSWGDGPWQQEVDRLEWRHNGFPCLMVRHASFGHWCGYVGIPPGHPYYEKNYDDVPVEIHGGLTYASQCNGHVCHVAMPGEPEHVWWLGFDCAHLGDLSPGMSADYRVSSREQYRTLAYVQRETNELATQLRSLSDV